MSWLNELPALQGEKALVVTPGEDDLALAMASRYESVTVLGPAEAARWVPEPAAFDMVAIAGALHRLASPTRLIYALKAALKPGGTFLIAEPIRVYQGTAEDLAVEAIQLWARVERARGEAVFDLFERLQVGSVIQGLGLEAIAFHPRLSGAGEWEAAPVWLARLEAIAHDAGVAAGDRARAEELAERFDREGMPAPPLMVTYGRLPAAVTAGS